MPTQTEYADQHLLALDPLRGLHKLADELDRLVELDPKLREARDRLEERGTSLSSAEGLDETLLPLLWLRVRDHLRSQRDLRAIRLAFGRGDAVLRWVDGALATSFEADVLEQVIEEARKLDQPEADAPSRLAEAREELLGGSPTERAGPTLWPIAAVMIVLEMVGSISHFDEAQLAAMNASYV